MIRKSLLLIFIFFLSLPAQIEIGSCGAVGIGADPDCAYDWTKVLISHNNSTSYGIYSRAYGSYSNYGVYARAYNGSSANYAIYANATGSGSNRWAGYFSGNVYTTGSYQSSDQRFKKNISPLNGKDILTKIDQLESVSFEFLNEIELRQKGLPTLNAKEGKHIGLLAQEVEKIFPELVMDVVNPVTDESGEPAPDQTFITTKAIDYNGLVAALIVAVQEQDARIEELEKKISSYDN